MPSRLGSETPFAPDNTPRYLRKREAPSLLQIGTATRMPADAADPQPNRYRMRQYIQPLTSRYVAGTSGKAMSTTGSCSGQRLPPRQC